MKKINYLLLILLLLAFLIRVVGIFPGYPPDHPDEPMSYSSAMEMIVHNDLNPRRFDYPSGVPLLHYLFHRSFVLPPMIAQALFLNPSSIIDLLLNRSAFMQEHSLILFGKNGVVFLFWSRFLTAVLGTASIFLLYKIGQKLFHPLVGLAGAFFLAFNYRHVLSSHLALSDIPNSFFALLSFFASLLLLENNTKKRYLLCGFLVGLSISMKYQIFAFLPFIFAHVVWVFRKKDLRYLFHTYFLLAVLIIPVIFVILNPYLFLNLKTALPVIQNVSVRYGVGIYTFNFYPLYYLFYWGIGMLPSFAIMLGFFFALIRASLKTLFLLSFIVPFFFIFLYYMSGGLYVRNFTTIIPFLMIFAGAMFGVRIDLFKNIVPKRIFLLLSVLILLIINSVSVKDSFILSYEYTKKWRRIVLSDWVVQHIPKGSKIINDNVGLPSSIDKPLEIIPWASEEGSSITQLSRKNIDFAVLNINWNQIYSFWFNTPYQELLLSGGIPYEKLKDSYHGLLLSEYRQYVVFETYKPWQASDHAYFVLKIPRIPSKKGKEIRSFHFTNDLEGWKTYDFSKSKTNVRASWDRKVGNNVNGSLLYHGSTNVQSLVRVTSPFIKILGGKAYKIIGFIRPKDVVNRRLQDGFLRVDFYSEKNESVLRDGQQISAVSERTFGKSAFTEKEIVVKAPKNARYLTVSLQHSKPENIMDGWGKNSVFWLDDVRLYELDGQLTDKFPKIPYILPTIPDDVLYANSII